MAVVPVDGRRGTSHASLFVARNISDVGTLQQCTFHGESERLHRIDAVDGTNPEIVS